MIAGAFVIVGDEKAEVGARGIPARALKNSLAINAILIE